jgi:uncharacterized protein
MATVFIFHGSYGHPEENWFPWLKDEVEKLGHVVIVPAFPTPKGQYLSVWLRVFKKYLPLVDSRAIFIGHSCGAIFALRLLEQIDTKIKAAFLVAGPVGPLHNEFDKVHMSFVGYPIDWKRVKSHAAHFYPIYSNNDPYISLKNGQITAKELGTKMIVVKNAGHFNAKAGYLKFEHLLDIIKKELQTS